MRGNFSIMQMTLLKIMITQEFRVLGENAGRRLFPWICAVLLDDFPTEGRKSRGGKARGAQHKAMEWNAQNSTAHPMKRPRDTTREEDIT